MYIYTYIYMHMYNLHNMHYIYYILCKIVGRNIKVNVFSLECLIYIYI